MRAIRSVPLAVFLLVLTAIAAVGPAAAQETLLQNDGYVSGQAVAFQSGFTATDMAASRFVPAGTGPWRVNRVHFLFGGSTATQTITLHVYDDTAGTLVPGTELFVGDFSVTGSNTEMQEADLTSSNVQVAGPFRVAIEFQHSGFPSVRQRPSRSTSPLPSPPRRGTSGSSRPDRRCPPCPASTTRQDRPGATTRSSRSTPPARSPLSSDSRRVPRST